MDGVSNEPEAEKWIFGDDPRAMEGFLRSLNANRDKKIVDGGHGIRTYPPSHRGGPIRIVNSVRQTCSCDYFRRGDGKCTELWEDAFRFGEYKGRRFVPPASRLKVYSKSSEKYDGVKRHRPRPNPMIDGLRYATHMKHARMAMPHEYKNHLYEAIKILLREDEKLVNAPKVGRPAVSLADAAFTAVVRIADQVSYEALEVIIPQLYNDGHISRKFSHARIIEAMGMLELGIFLERIVNVLIRAFRKTSKWLLLDGVVFSTARTDNSRKRRFTTDGPVQVLVHALYDYQWGFLVAFRITWFQRGRGSGESPQLRYLVTKALEQFDVEYVLADSAYHSKPNFKFGHDANFQLVSKPKRPSVNKDRSQKQKRADDEYLMAADDPLLKQLFVFRNRVEGWNDVLRETTEPYLISRVDRENYPEQTKEEKRAAEMEKEQPDLAHIDLPKPWEEAEEVIKTEQYVGITANNEMLCRQIYSFLRALSKAERYYGETVNFAGNRAFTPRPEDQQFSVMRPLNEDLIDDDVEQKHA